MSRIPIALNLYSLATDCAHDLAGTLGQVARMGFDGVELLTYYGRPAKELRHLLDDVGLKAAGVHVGSPGMGMGWGIDMLQGDNLKRTAEINAVLGNKYVIVALMEQKHMKTRDTWLSFAAKLNEIAAELRPYGIRVGYHGEGWEFMSVEDETPWDVMAANTNDDVVLQLDTMTVAEQGRDLIHYLEKYVERAPTVHLVEYAEDNRTPLIGEGDVPWSEVFRICETSGRTEWYIMEQERQRYSPLESVRRSLDNLRGLLGQPSASSA